jgi:sulfur-oxidizing protein SoxZ
MADAIRIRARQQGDHAEVLLLAPHVMETGLRRDAQGRPIAAHFITSLQVHLDGRLVLQADTSHAMSADPMLALRLRGARAGQVLRVSWSDNLGYRRTDEARIV